MSEAQVPSSSSALGPVKMGIVGAVAGLLIGAVLAYGRDRTMHHVGYADRLEDAGIPVHELGSTSEANDAFMLLRTMGAPRRRCEERWCSALVILPGTDCGLSTCTRCCSVFCLPSTHVSPITLRFVTSDPATPRVAG